MKVTIITKNSTDELQQSINEFLLYNNTVKNISYAIGAYPKGAEFSALLMHD